MMKGKQVYVTREIPVKGIDMLRKEGFRVKVWPLDRPMETAEILKESKGSQVLLTLSSDKISGDLLRSCDGLEMISQFAAGYDNIDIPAANDLGIPIGFAPGAMSDATADTAFGLMIAVSRKMFYMYSTIVKGEWLFFQPYANLGMELTNKTLGIFGLGRIGLVMAKRCRGAYNMNIIYCNRTPNSEAEDLLDAERVGFDELLERSDVLSVHSVLSEETREIFNKEAFARMKNSAIFINTSRGGVHNEEHLTDALREGVIWGAGLDVTNPEPMSKDNPLLFMENVCILPHIGSATVEARNEMSRMAAENIISYYKNGTVPNLVNPEVLHKS